MGDHQPIEETGSYKGERDGPKKGTGNTLREVLDLTIEGKNMDSLQRMRYSDY